MIAQLINMACALGFVIGVVAATVGASLDQLENNNEPAPNTGSSKRQELIDA